MAGASATMGAMNKFEIRMEITDREMDSSGVMKTAAEYQRQQAKVLKGHLYESQNEMVTQMMDDTLNTDISVEEEADEEVNKILMQVAGVRLDGMSLVPVGTVGSPEESTEDLDLEQLLRQMYRVSKQTQHSFSLNSFTSFFFRFSSLSFIFLITFGK